MSYILSIMVAYIIYSYRLNATWVKCHLVAINPSGIYHDYHYSSETISRIIGIFQRVVIDRIKIKQGDKSIIDFFCRGGRPGQTDQGGRGADHGKLTHQGGTHWYNRKAWLFIEVQG